ncbi:MAG TPA: hypothetical protein VE153_03395 [Myxococcus sp.]|nr:hypothetical protein [Myxococcus sp.]
MHQGRFRRWLLLPGALAAAALLGTACERDQSSLPRTGGEYEGQANDQQSSESFKAGGAPEQPSVGGQPDTGSDRPGTGGSGHDQLNQGAQTSPDEFRRPQQVPPGQENRGEQGATGGIGAPGHSTPEEQPTDQGGTRRFEELNGIGNERPSGEDRGPKSPPKLDEGQQGTDTPRP